MNGADLPIEPVFGSEKTIMHPALMSLLKNVKDSIQKKEGSSEKGVRIVNEIDWFYAIVLNFKNDINVGIYPQDVDHVYTLDHEIGHVLLNHHFINKIHRENAADAFAVIRNLQRFNNDAQVLSLLSFSRSYTAAYFGTIKHLTMPTINQILRDSKHINFKSLSPEETIKAAKNYTKKYAPSCPEIAAAERWTKVTHGMTSFYSNENFVKQVASAALSTSDRISFRLGVSIIKPFLNNPEGVIVEGVCIQLDNKTREKLRKQFINLAQQLNLPEIVRELKENTASFFIQTGITASKKNSNLEKTMVCHR